jgi:hypothetical protein
MKKLKVLAVALGAVAVTSSAFAIPTLTIWDAHVTVTQTTATGLLNYQNLTFDSGLWTVVATLSETKPAIGSATSPIMDLSVAATSLGGAAPANNLHISWSDNSFGPLNGSLAAHLTGNIVQGPASTVQFQTYYSAANGLSAGGTLAGVVYTDSGLVAANGLGSYLSGPLTGASIGSSAFGLTEVINITSSPGGSYSLDASLQGVPDGGTTVLLLGAALSGLAFLRRKLA